MKKIFQVLLLMLVSTKVDASYDQFVPTNDQEKRFDLALEYLNSFKNDDANLLLSELILELQKKQALNTLFGLSVRYRQADVLEKDHQNELAINILLSVVKDAQTIQDVKSLSLAHISLARLQEKIGRKEQCYSHLQSAKSYLVQHKIDSLFPRFYNRTSSYHRIFANKDSAIFYAQKALTISQIESKPLEEATANLLLGMLLSNKDYDRAVDHLSKAGKSYLQNEDYSGFGAIQSNLSKLHYRNGKKNLARTHVDSALFAAEQASKFGNETTWLFYVNYKTKSQIFQDFNQYDSALYYLKKGSEMELDEVRKTNHENVVRIDEKYKDEKKANRIKEQQKQIQISQERFYWSAAFSSTLLLFAGALGFYYYKLRAANQKTIAQSKAIENSNKELTDSLNEQLVLQGEIHHRVKNNLQVIISLLDLHKDEIKDETAKNSLDTLANRIYSIAAIHEILYQIKGTEKINLLDYTEHLCRHLKKINGVEIPTVFQLDIITHPFNLETLMPIGIILNELITNSMKHGKIKGKGLEINIELQRNNAGFDLKYRDNGPGYSKGQLADKQGSLGNYLLTSMSRQLNGTLVTGNDQGAMCSIYFEEKNKEHKDA